MIRRNQKATKVYIVNIAVPGGGSQEFLHSDEQAELWDADPDAYAAKLVGLTLAQYLLWIDTDGTPLCGAMTSSGKLCKNQVGVGQQGASAWLHNHHRSKCHAHGGE